MAAVALLASTQRPVNLKHTGGGLSVADPPAAAVAADEPLPLGPGDPPAGAPAAKALGVAAGATADTADEDWFADGGAERLPSCPCAAGMAAAASNVLNRMLVLLMGLTFVCRGASFWDASSGYYAP